MTRSQHRPSRPLQLWSGGLGLLTVLVVLASSGRAEAYPQWQFSSGTSRCSQCHYSPAGGGLITNYGRDAAGEDLSTWEGDGAFFHGGMDLPKAVAVGFDGRFAFLANDVGEKDGPKTAYFPMQADLQVRVALSDELSAYATGGFRGQARDGGQLLGPGAAEPEGITRFISREHWLMWRPEAMGPYARIGRFFAPFGLRLAEHYAYVRRDTGFNLLEETYGASFGYLQSDYELHLTAFVPDTLRYLGGTEKGAAGMVEYRVGDDSALGAQARVGITEDVYRYTGGGFGKTYFEDLKLLLQGEVNLTHQSFAGGSYATQAFNGYAGATLFPGRGFWITPFAERRQTSIRVKDSATNAAGLQVNWFPFPHFEITAMGRYQLPTGDSASSTGMVFIHYYL